MSFQEFIDMGGYGFYIWTSYLITAVLFIGLFISLKMQKNRLIKRLRRRNRHQQELTNKH
ncbi:MAG: heme exporter protein CcmD [Gammaproteobacteria bacterium]|nr:heme exporter protein CcmD [Gammaproteobacteria bacterium]